MIAPALAAAGINKWYAELKGYAACRPHPSWVRPEGPQHILVSEQWWFSIILLMAGCEMEYDANSWQNTGNCQDVSLDGSGRRIFLNHMRLHLYSRTQRKKHLKNIYMQISLFKLMFFMDNVLATCKQVLHTVLRRFTTPIPLKSWKIKLISWSVSP